MFGVLATILKSAFYAFLLHDHLKTKHNDKYNELLILATYKLIYLYSKCQIFLTKTNTHVQKILAKDFPQIHDAVQKMVRHKIYEENTVEYILDGKQLQINNLSSTFEPPPPETYDFVIISEFVHDNDHSYINKRIIKRFETWDTSFEESTIQFVLVEVFFNDVSIKVDLKTDKYNFYLVNNVLDEKFIKYLLHTYYSKELKEKEKEKEKEFDLEEITISILDQNVNKVEYTVKHDYIHIAKTNYFRKSDIITEE
jgi:hypothetical protein